MLLAIDTATHIMSLALHDGLNLTAEQTWRTDNNHTAELAPTIHELLQRCAVTFDDLTALAVSIGPGSYTGLRIGVALAKGIATVYSLPLVGISTLDTLAAAQPVYQGHALITTVEAGRGRVIAATYRWKKGQWGNRGEPQITDWPSLLSSIDGPAFIAGDIDEDGKAALLEAQANGVSVRLAPAVYRLRRAGFLAEEALALLAELGETAFNPAHLVPLYIKTKDSPA